MKRRFRLASVVVSLALAGVSCASPSAPAATPPEGPSSFLAGFSGARVVSSINATPDGASCPRVPTDLPPSRAARDGTFPGWSTTQITIDCDDTGDGTVLAQAWAAGIDAELNRLGAAASTTGKSGTASGATFTDTWEYQSSGLRGLITVRVLPAPEGRYWVVLRIFEPG